MVKLTGTINKQLGVRAVWSLQVEVQPDLPWIAHNGSVGDRRTLGRVDKGLEAHSYSGSWTCWVLLC